LKIHKFQGVTDLPHLDGISSSRFRVLLEQLQVLFSQSIYFFQRRFSL
jgi:hypothetical protein